MKNEKKGFQRGAFVLLCSAVIVKLIGALFKIPLSSKYCLGDLGFGYFSSAYDLFTPFYALAMAGLPVAVSKTVSEHFAHGRFKDVKQMLNVSRRVYLAAGLICFLCLCAFIYPFSRFTDSTGKGIYSLLAMTPSVVFCCLMSSYRGYYQGLNNMLPTAVSELLEALCKLILGFGFGFLTVRTTGNVAFGAAAAIFGITVGTALSTLYLWLCYKFKGDGITAEQLLCSPSEKSDNSAVKTLIMIAVPVALASLAGNIALIIDAITVRSQLGTLGENGFNVIREMYSLSIADYNKDAASAITNGELTALLYGIRGKAYTLFNLVPTITTVIGVSAVPVIAGLNAEKDYKALNCNLNSALKLTALISFPAGIGLFVAADRIMELLYDSTASVEIGAPLLRIFGITAIFAGVAIPLTGILQAKNKQKAALINVGLGAVAKLATGLLTVSNPKINVKGAAFGTLACYFVILVLHIAVLLRCEGVSVNIKAVFLKPLISAFVCGFLAWLVFKAGESVFVTALAIIFAAVVYIICLILVNAIDENDLNSLPKSEKLTEFCKKYKIIR
ncbi:MAG: polysaccharide biosynthesis protein [Acutalibacteraceae bacterium]|nr:polysaccharide biosynthesis protein [Acutalibacteraceae bacterium]